MYSNNVFKVTLLVSLVAHGVMLAQNPNFSILPKQNTQQEIKVSYVKTPPEQPDKQPKQKAIKQEAFLKLSSKITATEQKIPPPFVDRDSMFKGDKAIAEPKPAFFKPVFIKPDIIAIKKKITLPPIDTTKINNPSYISYYQIVREKIKRSAYQIYTGKEVGEVTVSFIISNEGYLKDLRLIEDKSTSSAYLIEIALKSIREASPFPNFPKELDYPQLTFNLAITFEIE